jgi:acetylornithine deacetylase
MSLRPAPGTVVGDLLAEAGRRARAATAPHAIEWRVRKENPAFATRDIAAFESLLGARARQPVDLAFWTEAALLSEAGIDAVVFGPGDIAQAHAADEFVPLADLETAQAIFEQVLAATSTP